MATSGQVPTALSVATDPKTLQTDTFRLENTTGNPDEAVATRLTVVCVNGVTAIEAKVMLCADLAGVVPAAKPITATGMSLETLVPSPSCP